MHLSPPNVSNERMNNANGTDNSNQLLFFDTFAHDVESGDTLNLDLVQFPSPVIVDEVRVIPLGARVPFPNGVRLGATNPTTFELELFVNDLGKPGAATFESLGTLHFSQGHRIKFQTSRFIPTDGLVLKGTYNAITLAVYGTLSKSTAEQLAQQAEAANAVADPVQHQPHDHLVSNGDQDDARSMSRDQSRSPGSDQLRTIQSSEPQPAPRTFRTDTPLAEPGSTPLDSPTSAPLVSSRDELFEEMSDISDGDIPEVQDDDEEQEPKPEDVPSSSNAEVSDAAEALKPTLDHDADMEEISDDEAEWSDDDGQSMSHDLDLDAEPWEEIVFDPFHSSIPEWPTSLPKSPITDSPFRTLLCDCAHQECNGEWISKVEELTSALNHNKVSQDDTELILKCATQALNRDLALQQSVPTDKVRHIKSGLSFVLSVARTSSDALVQLIKDNLLQQMIATISEKIMAHSIKMLAFLILDEALNHPVGFNAIMTKSSNQEPPKIYSTLLDFASTSSSTRIKMASQALLSKIHFHELWSNVGRLSREQIESGDKLEEISEALEAIFNTLKTADITLCQPNGALPVRFSMPPDPQARQRSLTSLLTFLQQTHFLDVMYFLMTMEDAKVASTSFKILDLLLELPLGTKVFCSKSEPANMILRFLVHQAEKAEEHQTHDLCYKLSMSTNAAHALESIRLESTVSQLCVEHLHTIYSMFYSNTGRFIVAKVCEDFIPVLVRLMNQKSGEQEEEDEFNVNPAVRHLASEILLNMLQNSDNISSLVGQADYLTQLQDDDNLFRHKDLSALTRPLEAHSDLPKLCEMAKKLAEKTEHSSVAPDLSMALRLILWHCDINSRKTENLLTIHSSGLLDSLSGLLSKICDLHPYPLLHPITFGTSFGLTLMKGLSLVVQPFKRLLRFVLQSRGSDFEDTSLIPIMIRVHALCISVPTGTECKQQSDFVAQDALEVLSLFTLPVINLKDCGVTATNCWSGLINELCDHIIRAPKNMCPGLRLFSDLLPSQLPFECEGGLTVDEESKILNSRKLWSAHLIQAEAKVRLMLRQWLGVQDRTSLFWMKKVCGQLADLSYPTAAFVCEELEAAMTDRRSGETASFKVAAEMLEIAAIKVGFLDLLSKQAVKEGENGLISALTDLLQNENGAQDVILNLIAKLCDVTGSWTQACSLPVLKSLADIVAKIMSSASNLKLTTDCLETISFIAQHKNGRASLISTSSPFPKALQNVLELIDNNGDQDGSVDAVRAIIELAQPFMEDQKRFQLAKVFRGCKGVEQTLRKVVDSLEDGEKEADLKSKLDCLVFGLSQEDESVPEEDGNNEDYSYKSVAELFDNRPLVGAVSRPTTDDDLAAATSNEVMIDVDLLDIGESSLVKDFDIISEMKLACHEKILDEARGNDHVDEAKSALERKILHNKDLISNFKAGGVSTLRHPGGGSGSRGFGRTTHQRPDGFRSRPPNTSRPPSLHVDDFLLLQSRGQQPTGPTGYNKQSLKAAKELFAQREAEQQAKSSLVGFREATKEPVYGHSGRPPPTGGRRPRDGKPMGGGRGRHRGWSPMYPPDERRKYFGERRGGGGGGPIRDRRSKGRDDRPRHPRHPIPR